MQVGYQRCNSPIKSQTHIGGALQLRILGYNLQPLQSSPLEWTGSWSLRLLEDPRVQVALECTKDNTREAPLQVINTSATASMIKHLIRKHRVRLQREGKKIKKEKNKK